MADEMDRVVPLDELDDFKVASGDPDVRGWEVMSSDGRKIGEVDNLLIDTGAMKVRYLDVDLDDEIVGSGDNRHILIPIGYARLNEDDDRISVDSLNSTAIAGLPAYRSEPLTRDYEDSVRQHFAGGTAAAGGAAASAGAGNEYYANEGYDDDRFYGSRRGGSNEEKMTLSEEQLAVSRRDHKAGEVEVHKEVETRHVRESVPVMHEEVTVERRPIQDGMHGKARIEEDEVRVPIYEEELVVDKRVVPTEEIVVKKREVVENETVEADLRRERVDINKEGDVDLRDDR
ncbi:MAG: DUF2382 domain-containing protein [Gemmatimonadetes bacterium]|nr:DUF2382 domain-containing protein [Gemmatimonadota bacterium]